MVVTEPKRLALVLHRDDNVAVALTNLRRGQEVSVSVDGGVLTVVLVDDIPFGHKFAIRDIPTGGFVVKYGEVIGVATRPIKVGEHVHVHNVKSTRI